MTRKSAWEAAGHAVGGYLVHDLPGGGFAVFGKTMGGGWRRDAAEVFESPEAAVVWLGEREADRADRAAASEALGREMLAELWALVGKLSDGNGVGTFGVGRDGLPALALAAADERRAERAAQVSENAATRS